MIEPIRQWPYTKFEKCDPPLGTINGIGITLCGGWGRYDPDTNSTVYYLFFSFVIPLIPMGKLIQPEDIAETILFLASKQARMITGQIIKVSGGKAL